jgi:hypothetical protein
MRHKQGEELETKSKTDPDRVKKSTSKFTEAMIRLVLPKVKLILVSLQLNSSLVSRLSPPEKRRISGGIHRFVAVSWRVRHQEPGEAPVSHTSASVMVPSARYVIDHQGRHSHRCN